MPLSLHGLISNVPGDGFSGEQIAEMSLHTIPGMRHLAVCTPLVEAAVSDPETEVRFALRHHDLLTRLAQVTDVLPVRFGTAFSSEDTMRATLAEQSEHYIKAAARIAGAVEFSLRVTRSDKGSPQEARTNHRQPTNSDRNGPEETGRGFLARRRIARDSRAIAAADLATFLNAVAQRTQGLSRAVAVGAPKDDRLFDLALLVERGRVRDLESALGDIHGDAGALGVEVALLGPWPAYSFCAAEDHLPSTSPASRAA